MYRARVGKKLESTTLEFLSSLSDDYEIARYDVMGSYAHVLMLKNKNLLSSKEASKLLQALYDITEQDIVENKSEAEDIHELVESLVTKKAGTKTAGKMHTARSRNDQVTLDMHLKIRDDIDTICYYLITLIGSLLELASKNKGTIMPLYTHLQQGQVGVFSHYLLSYVDALFRDVDRFFVNYGRINQCPLGAGPIGGTSIDIDRHNVERLLGFKGLVENSIDATTSKDVLAEFVNNVTIMMVNLSRVAEDFIIWSTSEFSFLDLPNQFTSTSSVMPQKKNPDVLELTRAKAAEVIGYQTAMFSTLKGLPSGYNRDLQQVKKFVINSSRIALSSLMLFNSMLPAIAVNKQNMKNSLKSGYILALDIAEDLVKEGAPFRSAYSVVGKLVLTAFNSKKTLSKLSVKEIQQCVGKTNKDTSIDVSTIQKIISKKSATSSLGLRMSQGSSGFEEQKRMISDRHNKAKAYKSGIQKRTLEKRTAIENLLKNVQETTKNQGRK